MTRSTKSPLPFIKWAGGKGSLLQHLAKYMPSRVVNYHEPFVGGGALFFATYAAGSRFKAFLSDTNEELINAYRVVKSRPRELIRSLDVIQREYFSARNKGSYYYKQRERAPRGAVQAAARFIFLNKTCYNGLYRVSASNQFNVPFGGYKGRRKLDQWNILFVSKALREAKTLLRSIDYMEATKRCKSGDFVYLDPPYNPTSATSSFTDYTRNGFSEVDQRQLSHVFSDLVGRGCLVLMSNSDTPLIRKLFDKYNFDRVKVNRPINCIGDRRRGFGEVIILGGVPEKNRRARESRSQILLEAS